MFLPKNDHLAIHYGKALDCAKLTYKKHLIGVFYFSILISMQIWKLEIGRTSTTLWETLPTVLCHLSYLQIHKELPQAAHILSMEK